jgi:hypothetical protein
MQVAIIASAHLTLFVMGPFDLLENTTVTRGKSIARGSPASVIITYQIPNRAIMKSKSNTVGTKNYSVNSI